MERRTKSTDKQPSPPLMCKQCVKSPLPDRGSVCCDHGAYLLNLARQCPNCGARGPWQKEDNCATEGVEEEEKSSDGLVSTTLEEVKTYEHVCSSCGHLICRHEYSFVTDGIEEQRYTMACLLCGRGVDTKKFTHLEESSSDDPTSDEMESLQQHHEAKENRAAIAPKPKPSGDVFFSPSFAEMLSKSGVEMKNFNRVSFREASDDDDGEDWV